MKTLLKTVATVVGAATVTISLGSAAQERTKRFQIEEATLVQSIGAQVQRCWFLAAEQRGKGDLAVRVRFGLFPDGSLRSGPTIADPPRIRSRELRAAAAAARRAVHECTPLAGLPLANYEAWREVELVFDPTSLLDPNEVVVQAERVRVTALPDRDRNKDREFDAVGKANAPGGSSAPSDPAGSDGGGPGAEGPSADDPSPDSPGADVPGSDDPSGGSPGADVPGSDDPSGGSPGADSPVAGPPESDGDSDAPSNSEASRGENVSQSNSATLSSSSNSAGGSNTSVNFNVD